VVLLVEIAVHKANFRCLLDSLSVFDVKSVVSFSKLTLRSFLPNVDILL
jgi:hypothetical protein